MRWQPIPSVTEPHYLDDGLNQFSGFSGIQKCLNWYHQKTLSGYILKSLHGYATLNSIAATMRGAIFDSISGYVFAAYGNKVYRINGGGTATLLAGTLTTTTGACVLSSGLTQVMLVDGTNGYVIDPNLLTVTQITDLNFPASPISCACINGQFLVAPYASDRWYMSAVDDGFTWTPIISGRTMTNGDRLFHIVVIRDVVYFMGKSTIEIWSPSTVDPYLQPITGSTIAVGITSSLDVSVSGDALFIYGRSGGFSRAFYKLDSGGLSKISTPYIDSQISFSSSGTPRVVAYQWDGCEFAEFYDRTSIGFASFLYNNTFGTWSEFDTDRKLAYVCTAFEASNPLALQSTGSIVGLDVGNDYNGTAISRVLDFTIDGGMSRVFIAGLRFEFEAKHDTASSYTLSATLQKSDDGGRTFNTGITLSKTVTNGTSVQSVMLQSPPLGSADGGRVFRLTMTPSARLILRRAEGLVRVGRF